MDKKRMIERAIVHRSGGALLALAGFMYLPIPLFDAWRGINDIGGDSWWIVYTIATTHHFCLLFGLFTVFAGQFEKAGLLGVVAFVVASLGNALVGGVGLIQMTILPALFGNPETRAMLVCTPFYPPATEAAAGFIESACEAWDFRLLFAIVTASWLTLIAGSVLLGVSIALARVLPVVGGLLIVAGWLVNFASLLLPAPELAANAAYLLIGLGYAWVGGAIVRRPPPLQTYTL
jgi:hypothetical protein